MEVMAHGGHEGLPHAGAMDDVGGMPMPMSMSFNFDVNPVLLFSFWQPKDAVTLAASCLLIFFMTVAFEALKAYREKLYIDSRSSPNTQLLSSEESPSCKSMFHPSHLLQTVLYTAQITLGYSLMLLFMSFNGFVAITIIVGAAFGFLITGWKKFLMLEMASDHCG